MYRKLFEDIFSDHDIKKAVNRVKREIGVKILTEDGAEMEIWQPYKGGEPTEEDGELLYKNAIYYLCRTCIRVDAID